MPKRSQRLEYTPLATVKNIHGVKCYFELCADVFIGPKDLLVATGIAPANMFPGGPGMPVSAVDVWPRGSSPAPRGQVDGHLQIRRNPSGLFTVARFVSEAEAARRKAADDRRMTLIRSRPGRCPLEEPSCIGPAMVRLSRDEMPVTKDEKVARQLMEDLCSRHMLPQ